MPKAKGSRETELMHHRWPVGPGPSSKTWPRWEPQFLQSTSVRLMKKLRSSRSEAKAAALVAEVREMVARART